MNFVNLSINQLAIFRMKICICNIIFYVLFVNISFCQSGTLTRQWDHSYGGEGSEFISKLIPTPDGGFLLAGSSNSHKGYEKAQDNFDASKATEDYWIIKCDAAGTLLWSQTYGGSDNDFLYNAIATRDNGFLLIGRSKSPAGGNISQPLKGEFDIWIVKITSTGAIEWDKRFGGSVNNGANAAVELGDGGFLIGGSTNSDMGIDVSENGYGSYDYWLIRTDKNGNRLWDKRYGGNGDESLVSILHAPKGRFYLFGTSYSAASGIKSQQNYTTGESDMWIVEIDSSGNYISDKIFGSHENDLRVDAVETKDGHYVFAALTSAGIGGDKTVANAGVDDFWVIKMDSVLNKVWDIGIGGNLNECSGPNLFPTADSCFLISGTTYSEKSKWKTEVNVGPENTWAVKFDKDGNKIWDKTVLTGFSHDESGMCAELKDGCVIVANNGDALIGQEKTDQSWSFDFWVIKYCQEPPVAAFQASDTIICENSYISFTDTSLRSPTSWYWQFPGGEPSFSNQQHQQNILYKSAGKYTVSLKAANSVGKDSIVKQSHITVVTAPTVNLGKDTILCEGQTLELNAGEANTFLWNTGEKTATIQVQKAGKYRVEITNKEGCKGSDTIEVKYLQLPIVNLGADRVICDGNTILLKAPENAEKYLWQDGSTASTFFANKPGTYWVEVKNGLCKGRDEIVILPCVDDFNPNDTATSYLFFPNAFSPNDDKYNDVLAPVSYNLVSYQLQIYNRWGELIFETKNPEEVWDGTFKNKLVPEGAYLAIVFALGADAKRYDLSQIIHIIY